MNEQFYKRYPSMFDSSIGYWWDHWWVAHDPPNLTDAVSSLLIDLRDELKGKLCDAV
jgi:hypothetical protein